MVECAHCAYMFCNKRILKRHLYSVHNESKNTPGFVLKRLEKFTDIQCLEKGCRCKFHSKILFISHLKFDHYMDFDVQCLKFPSENGNRFYLYILFVRVSFCIFNLECICFRIFVVEGKL